MTGARRAEPRRRARRDKPAGTAAARARPDRSRRDRWWVAPAGVQGICFTVCATYLFFSGILWTPLFGTPYEVDGYLSPLFSPLIAPGLAADLDQPRPPDPVDPARLPGHLLLLPQGLLPLLLRRPAGLRGRRADRPPPLQDGDGASRSSSRTSTATSCTSRSSRFLPVDRRDRVALPGRAASRIGLGSARPRLQRALLTGYSLSCHSLRHLVGGRSTASRARAPPGALHAVAADHVAQPAPHGAGRGRA